jgi:predicted PurR-regulated permease PerM
MAGEETTVSTTWNDSTIRIVAVALGIAILAVIVVTHYVWGYLLVAAALAYLLTPFIALLQQRLRFPRGLAILAAYVLAIILFILGLLLLPAILASFVELGAGLAAALNDIAVGLTQILEGLQTIAILDIGIDLSPIIEPLLLFLESLSLASLLSIGKEIVQAFGSFLGFAGQAVISLVDIAISFGIAVVVTLTYSVYMSVDGGRMHRSLVNTIPPAYRDEITMLGQRIGLVWRTYIRGQLGVMLAVGVVTTCVAWLLGLPAPLALGIIAGLLEIIPYFGPFLAAIPAVILALFVGSTRFDISNLAFAVIVGIAYLLIQQLEDLVLTPRIQGKASEMPPLVIMISIVVAFEIAGIFGAIIAIPVAATGREIFNFLSAKLQKQAPYPESVSSEA